ncbi:sugar transporter SWEET1 [Cephus cinctus]|uniref:Sugar transporter SWEET1 n=1 Tax=Cephus cinctus TaxID=211228 RepID=A0AAJ7FM58_CEPCN|nr:sugar transporter SWEET1 [Cephus cinctus]XP_015598629.1 sugar transporter SWEET1 [Cephus cinctus]XP_015598630.1 sugar transporter SWEET1 [Cephus cinctus]XP_024942448.1 sugar transporter SWEET1 [Cephus cinctus]XP_024942449.1 sugar transporter SWEET1 [Cephus cinctus]XP_024942450.1 sugar transporter SWEET1 [Cephus cinctus]
MVSTAFRDALATTASCCTILQFLAGILVCQKIVKKGTTGETSGLAFVTCFMSCSLWLLYGILKNDSFIVLVNVFGTSLQLSYTFVFILYSVKKSVVIKQFAVAICFVTAMYMYSFSEPDKALATKWTGLLSCGLTIIFFASPLTMLAHVMKVKSAEGLPFPVITASLIVSCLWFIYGCIQDDPFIKIPNFLGSILSAFQLSLFVIYPGKKSDQIRLV